MSHLAVEGLRAEQAAVIALYKGLSDEERAMPSDCDGWTIRDVLAHAAGLTAYLPFYRDYRGRVEFQPAIASLPLEYAPRSKSIYSDLGFILLAFILEDTHPPAPAFRGASGSLDLSRSFATQFHRLASFFTAEPLRFNPPRAWRERTAPTAWGRLCATPNRQSFWTGRANCLPRRFATSTL